MLCEPVRSSVQPLKFDEPQWPRLQQHEPHVTILQGNSDTPAKGWTAISIHDVEYETSALAEWSPDPPPWGHPLTG